MNASGGGVANLFPVNRTMTTDPQQRIRAHFEQGGSLTVQAAIQRYNTTELRRIVSRLRKIGMNIGSQWIEVVTKDGRTQRVKVYAKQVADA